MSARSIAVRQPVVIVLNDGETGEVVALSFKNRQLHRLLVEVDEGHRPDVVRDALDLGAEMLSRVGHHGDLEQLSRAVERLDVEGKRIVEAALQKVDQVVDETVKNLTLALANDESGPLAGILAQFDPARDGNVLDTFKNLVGTTIARATKEAVKDLAEATKRQVDTLSSSLAVLEKVAAVEEARLAEAKKGTAKGLDHEHDVESLLGDLVGTVGDGLDDVSTVVGLAGNKRGDKVINPIGGCPIVTEEKFTERLTESKARTLLTDAMENRGAELGMLIVEDESKVPGNQPYHLIGDNMVVVAADRQTLRLVYCYMRAKAVERAQSMRHVDDHRMVEAVDAIRSHVEELRRSLERFKLLRTEHTKAAKAIGQAGGYVDDLALTIADGVSHITALIDGIVEGAQAEVAA